MDAVAPHLTVEEKRTRAGRFREGLASVREALAPVAPTGTRVLPVPSPLALLLPDGGLRRGTVVEVGGRAGTALTLALLGPATAEGAWVAFVGSEDLGLLAGRELGVDLRRCLLVDPPAGSRLAEALALLVDVVDAIVLGPSLGLGAAVERRLRARARERGVVVLSRRAEGDGPPADPPDVRLAGEEEEWVGLAAGAGRLTARRLRVAARGRGSAARPRSVEVWLPAPGGDGVASVERAITGSG